MIMLKNTIRALRLPFLSVSILPFIFGSLIDRYDFNLLGFMLGFICVLATHLAANLINDYADSKSGADWQDKNFYKFFGGSKLIQEHVFSEKFYYNLAVIFVLISVCAALLLAGLLKSISVAILYAMIIFLSWEYSLKPFEFSYRGLGEIVIFLLFGPALVMGGYFIQTKIFPDLKSFILSLPFGFFTTAILFANEIPDFREDKKIGKCTWVGLLGPGRSFILYLIIIFLGFLSIFFGIARGYLNQISRLSIILIFFVVWAANILKKFPKEKLKLVKASRLTIAFQTLAGIILIWGLFK